MLLEITKPLFESIIPSAIDPESGLFDRVKPFMETADMMLRTSLLGEELYQALHEAFSPAGLDGEHDVSPLSPSTDFRRPATIEMIASSAQCYIINQAMVLAIPQIDLVLTSSGFGVVSSSQIAPASRERVENLRRSCLGLALHWRDKLLLQLLGNAFTQPLAIASHEFVSATSSLFWTDEDLKKFVDINDESMNIWRFRPRISEAEMVVARHISRQQLDALFAKMRQSDLTSAQLDVITQLRNVVAALVNLPPGAPKALALRYFRTIYEVMEDNPDDFAEYHASSIYAGRHAPIYENKAQDPLFALL